MDGPMTARDVFSIACSFCKLHGLEQLERGFLQALQTPQREDNLNTPQNQHTAESIHRRMVRNAYLGNIRQQKCVLISLI
jgi:hypothetical protein